MLEALRRQDEEGGEKRVEHVIECLLLLQEEESAYILSCCAAHPGDTIDSPARDGHVLLLLRLSLTTEKRDGPPQIKTRMRFREGKERRQQKMTRDSNGRRIIVNTLLLSLAIDDGKNG